MSWPVASTSTWLTSVLPRIETATGPARSWHSGPLAALHSFVPLFQATTIIIRAHRVRYYGVRSYAHPMPWRSYDLFWNYHLLLAIRSYRPVQIDYAESKPLQFVQSMNDLPGKVCDLSLVISYPISYKFAMCKHSAIVTSTVLQQLRVWAVRNVVTQS